MATAKKQRSFELRSLGRRAKYVREQLGYGLREAAELAGIDNSILARLETGERLTALDVLIALARFYDIRLDWLIANEGPMWRGDKGGPPSRNNGGTRPRGIGDRRRRAAVDEA